MQTNARPYRGPVFSVKLVREAPRAFVPPAFACAGDIRAYMAPHMERLPHEEFWVLSCDVKNRITGSMMISRGNIESTFADAREVFRMAILTNAASIVLVHNHPSGDPEPSPQDRELTKRLHEAGVVLSIRVLDHVVIGRRLGEGQSGYVSFAERGWV